jgi:hypothetical protein
MHLRLRGDDSRVLFALDSMAEDGQQVFSTVNCDIAIKNIAGSMRLKKAGFIRQRTFPHVLQCFMVLQGSFGGGDVGILGLPELEQALVWWFSH